MPHITATKRQLSGFSLIELIVVVVLISIIAASLYSRGPGQGIDIAGLAHQLADDIRYTQSLSMTQGQRFRITLTPGPPASYLISDFAGNPITHPATNTTAAIPLAPADITIAGLANNLIAFDGQGRPYNNAAATTALPALATITLGTGPDARTVTIALQTGRVQVQ